MDAASRLLRMAVAVASVVLLSSCGGAGSNGDAEQPPPAKSDNAGAQEQPGKASPMTKLTPEEMIRPPSKVQSLLGLRDLSGADVRSLMKVASGDVANDVAYEKLSNVSRVSNGDVFPGHFFLRGDEVVMVYASDGQFLQGLSADGIRGELGGKGVELRSRAGKTSNQYVYPGKGFAFSENNGAVEFIEVFPPMSLDDYKAKIYNDVGDFIR